MKKSSFSGGYDLSLYDAQSYTLVTILIDYSNSVKGFAKILWECLLRVIDACKKSPSSENILIRVVLFSTKYPTGSYEIHGFKLASEIMNKDYEGLVPDGGTPLNRATLDSIDPMVQLATELDKKEITVNAIKFIISDGWDSVEDSAKHLKVDAEEIGVKLKDIAGPGKPLESLTTVFLAINTNEHKPKIKMFKEKAGIQHLMEADSTTASLMKVSRFMSGSVMSASKKVGTGFGPDISVTI